MGVVQHTIPYLLWEVLVSLHYHLKFVPLKVYGLDDATFYTQEFQSYKNSLSNFTVEVRLSHVIILPCQQKISVVATNLL